MKISVFTLICLLVSQISTAQINNHKIPDYKNECIEYNLYYGIFKIGEAKFYFGSYEKCGYAFIMAEAKSTGLVKFVKNIHFRYESCMDTLTGLPIYDSRILIEGDYLDTNTTYYFRTLLPDSTIVYSKKTDSLTVQKNIYDILTGFLDFRANAIDFHMPRDYLYHKTTFFVDETWDLDITYNGMERLKTNLGRLNCYKFKPKTSVGHFFKSSDAMTIWVTRKKDYIPVKFQVELKVGTIYGVLTKYNKPHIPT